MAEDGRAPYKIVTIVAPISNDPNTSGKVVNLSCGGGVGHRQVVRQDDGSYEMVPSWHRRGWRLLKDMYLEEHDEEGWEFYARYVVSWQAGRTRSPFPKSRLPKSVLERQRCMIVDEFADDFRTAPVTGAAKPEPAEEVKPEVQPEPQPEQATGRKGARS